MTAGYLHPNYAASLAEWGTPRPLAASGGWVLERAIAGTAARDAMGLYPLFTCGEWDGLGSDLAAVGREWVSLTAVTDPFAPVEEGQLREWFPDVCRPFKEHFVVDLTRPPDEFVHPHHLRNARAAAVRVDFQVPTPQLLARWVELYANLVARHGITGMTAFSPEAFARQFAVPGLVVQTATCDGACEGMVLWYTMADRAYYHLGAYSEKGYDLKASFALFRAALDHFAAVGVKWLNLGAGAGAAGDGDDGLTRFKKGWATGTKTAYLCGRVFDPDRYRELSAGQGGAYFPAYRAGEFQ